MTSGPASAAPSSVSTALPGTTPAEPVLAHVYGAASAAPLSIYGPLFDPATLGWPPFLPIELALGEERPRQICENYGIDKDQFLALLTLPAFVKAVLDAKEMMAKEGMSFRMKARMQAEALLKTSWQLIHNPHTPSNVKADLIKTTMRVAGYEPKETDRTAVLPLQINIQL
jgi:hypothetical protein